MTTRKQITNALIGQTDIYKVWQEDGYLYLYDYFVVVTTADTKVEYHHRHTFRTEEEAEKMKARIVEVGSIDPQHWYEVAVLTTEERFAETLEWERKHDELHGHW